MPDEWVVNAAKNAVRAWLTAKERVVTAGHEFAEMLEDLVEEVRHERAMEAQQPTTDVPTPASSEPKSTPATPRRRASTSASSAGRATPASDAADGATSPRPTRRRPTAAKAAGDTAAPKPRVRRKRAAPVDPPSDSEPTPAPIDASVADASADSKPNPAPTEAPPSDN